MEWVKVTHIRLLFASQGLMLGLLCVFNERVALLARYRNCFYCLWIKSFYSFKRNSQAHGLSSAISVKAVDRLTAY
jgi:hypothetical protein